MCAAQVRSVVDDARYMARALQLAERGYYSARPNPRVGCVVTNGGRIVGEGFHYCAGEPHAEVNALDVAGDAARGGTVYVTLEPCCHHGLTPPCTGALIAAGVARVVYGAMDPDPRVAGRGVERLREAGIEIGDGVMAERVTALNRGFFRRMRDGLPFVSIKIGMTIDAKIALETGASRWITSAAARSDVQRLRAANGAIITGVGTVIADDPALTVRDKRFDIARRQPLRVILDTDARVPPSSKIFRQAGETIVFTANNDANIVAALESVGAKIEHVRRLDAGLDLEAILRRLASLEINDVLVEAGPAIVRSFIHGGLFDELVIYMAPTIFGDSAIDAFHLPPPFGIDAASALEFVDVRRVGTDLRVTLRPRG